MKVEIWSDVVCPWCFIGKRRFDKAVEQLRLDGITEPITVEFKAFQLDPTAPTGKPTPVIDAYAKKFGGQERAAQILNHVTKVAAEDGITFNMDIALRANTILAHRALHWVLVQAGAESQVVFKERLLAAYFTEGLDVGDLSVISQCASECGHDADALISYLEAGGGIEEVRHDLEGAMAREITAVPTFVIDDKYMVPGAQDSQFFINALKKILSR